MKYPPKGVMGIRHVDWVQFIITTELPAHCKWLAAYLATFMNSHKDIAYPSQARIVAETSLSKATVNRSLNLLEEEGWLGRERGGPTTTTRYFVKMPEEIEKQFEKLGGSLTERLGWSQGETRVVSQRDTNKQVKYTNIKKPLSKPDGFDEFWTSYPRKEGKKAAIRAWGKLSKKKRDAAISDVRSGRYDDTPRQYIPLPATYINGERFEDVRPGATAGNYGEGGI